VRNIFLYGKRFEKSRRKIFKMDIFKKLRRFLNYSPFNPFA